MFVNRIRAFPFLASAAVAAGVAASAWAATSANSLALADPSGDAGPAPDVTVVRLSSDDAGLVRIRVDIPNRPALVAGDDVQLVFDVDDDGTTGDDGWDHVLNVDEAGPDLQRWSGSRWIPVSPSGSPNWEYAYTGNGFDVAIPRADLALTGQFEFYALARAGDAESAQELAPDGEATWHYHLRLPYGLYESPLTGRLDFPDAPARAGRQFSLSLRASRADTGQPLHEGAVRCTAHVGARALPARTGRFFSLTVVGVGDRTKAVCGGWKLPNAARGKTLTATIAVSHRGASLSRTYRARIR